MRLRPGIPACGVRSRTIILPVLVCAVLVSFMAGHHAHAQRPPLPQAKSAPLLSLHDAATTGDLGRVKDLLDGGADINALSNQERETPLLAALKANKAEVARFLLDRGADVNMAGLGNDTPLIHAAYWGQVDLIQRIKSMRGAVAHLDNKGRLPLHHAVDRRHLEAARLLLPRRGLLGLRDGLGNAPFDLALSNDDENMAVFLLEAGAPFADDPLLAELRMDRCVQKNWALAIDRMIAQLAAQPGRHQALLDRAYALAFAEGNIDLLDRFAAAGANANGPLASGVSQLFAAADFGHEHLVQRLLAADADPNTAEPGSRWTPLHAAAMNRKPGVIQLLLDKSADPNAADGLQRTPLHLAVIAANPNIVNRLLKAGADPARLDYLGNSALHYAAQSSSLPIVRKLAEAGAPQRPNAAGLTPFDLAGDAQPEIQAALQPPVRAAAPSLPEGFDALAPLLASDASPEAAATARQQWTPVAAQGTPFLHIAVQAASLEAVKRLLDENPARLSERDSAGFLPIHLAAEITDTAILHELLARGAAVNDNQNSAKWTPLHFAAATGNAKILRLLLDKGADRSARDGLDHTPADIARQAGKPASLTALQ